MKDYYITLKPVYSCPASELPAQIKLPEGWSSLAWHQVETFRALDDPEVDVVFNVAMTGDGKSLAAYLRTLSEKNYCVIGLYPTNELARDQEQQIKKYLEDFKPPNDPRVFRLSGPELEIAAEVDNLRKGTELDKRFGQSEILLTNPDIFHYLHRGAYLLPKDNPDKFWGKLDKDFSLFIFDEFHVFAPPQIAGVINTMLLIRLTNRKKKFLFLSATPDEELINRLRSAGFRCRLINPEAQGKYQFPVGLEQQEQLKSANWRQVVRQIQLNFIPLDTGIKSAETWLKENIALIGQYFQQHRGSKGAIILNSIATVKRLTPFFRESLPELIIGENTGLSGKSTKEKSLEADLILGTSTIDVGVDFKINFLIFDSADAGNFIQRLGRLGRHEGFLDRKFSQFIAYALVPSFFVERLFAGESPPLISGEVYDRPTLHNIVRDKYRRINNFDNYYQYWGAVQSFGLLYQLGNSAIKSNYNRENFQTACETAFKVDIKKVAGRVSYWRRSWQQLSGRKDGNPIAEEACSFRGSSPLQCGVYDSTEKYEGDRFKTYDLPGILSNLKIEVLTKSEFIRTLKATATRIGKLIADGHFDHCLAFFKLVDYHEERLNWKFYYSGDLAELANSYEVQVLAGLEVWQSENPWVRQINKRLSQEGLVCYLVQGRTQELRIQLQLPMHFQLYPICDQHSIHEPIAPYAIAFGQSALLLHTLVYRLKPKGGDAIVY